MIIIKTSNGDAFVNEKTTQIVEHDRKNKMVVIRSPKEGLNCNIHDVECIIYTNDAQPTSWRNEGSELEQSRKDNEEKSEIIRRLEKEKRTVMHDLHQFAFDMEQIVCKYHDDLPDTVRQLIQTDALRYKSKVLHNGYDSDTEQ